MAGTSPSGSSRRLSELLGEQQDPFSLELYLLEKGCSSALLDAATGCSCATPTCWPRGSSTTRALTRRPVESKKGSWGNDALRLLLSKILRRTGAVATARKKQLRPAAVHWRGVHGENTRTPESFMSALPSGQPVEADMGEAEDDDEEDDDDGGGSKKQLSPVSVLEQRQFEELPPAHAQKALVIFSELMQAAYTPTLVDLLAIAKGNSSSNNINSSKGCRCNGTSTPARKGHARWGDLLEDDLAKVTQLIASEMAGARVRADDVLPEQQEVGAAIAAAVLEALAEETAAVLVGMDHDCAVDTARW